MSKALSEDSHNISPEHEGAKEETRFTDAVTSFFTSPLDYEGVSNRRQFWFVQMFIFAVNIIALSPLVYFSLIPSPGPRFDMMMLSLWIAYIVVNIVLLFFTIPLTVRRIRDTGITPYAALLLLIPFIGSLIVLIMCALPTKLADSDSEML